MLQAIEIRPEMEQSDVAVRVHCAGITSARSGLASHEIHISVCISSVLANGLQGLFLRGDRGDS